MDPLDQQVQAGFRRWDEQRLRLRLFKQQLRQRQDQPGLDLGDLHRRVEIPERAAAADRQPDPGRK